MCGIAGYIGEKHKNILPVMLEKIEHRGRDGRVQFSYKNTSIGMNRLAINDVKHNVFPLQYKHYTVVFNGEIYNYLDLKALLEKQGVKFKTDCDAEVIAPLFDICGTKAFEKFEGMFAICILDRKTQKVILVRDKFGEKPLYMYKNASGILFASEMKAILSVIPTFSKLYSPLLGHYFSQGFVSNNKTLVDGISKVLPAHVIYISLSTQNIRTKSYWQKPVFTPKKQSEHKMVAMLDTLIESSVKSRLLADVPVGSLLSGGIDSSLISLNASRLIPEIRTFSISYPSHPQDDESFFAKKVAHWLGTDHQDIPCTAHEVRSVIQAIGSISDEPVVDPAMLPTYMVANQARKYVKVVLTGVGADEIFAGYDRYAGYLRQHRYRSFIQSLSIIKYIREAVLLEGKDINTKIKQIAYLPQNIWNPHELAILLRSSRKVTSPPSVSYTNDKLFAMQSTDMRGYLACQVLTMVDTMTMANNLEARAPYLDTAIVEFAATLPDNMLIRGNQTKYILRKVAQKHFPLWFAQRLKHGFSVPLRDWFNSQLRPEVETMVDQVQVYQELFNIFYIQEIVREHEARSQDHSEKIWSLIVLCSWLTFHKIRA